MNKRNTNKLWKYNENKIKKIDKKHQNVKYDKY